MTATLPTFAPHTVTRSNPETAARLDAMLATLKAGGALPAIVAHEEQALTGSHRMEAIREALNLREGDDWETWEGAEIDLEVVEVSGEEWVTAMDACGCSPDEFEMVDLNSLCAALHRITSDSDIKEALADQVID